MFNVQKASIKAKALPVLKSILENEGKETPNLDDISVLTTLYVEKYNKQPDGFNDLFLFRENLIEANKTHYEAIEKYNGYVKQFDSLLKGEKVFGFTLVNEVRKAFTELGINAIRVNVEGLQLQAQFSNQKNEFVNFAPFTTTVNPSQIKPVVKATISNVNTSDTRKHCVTIEGVQYKNLVEYAKSNIADLSKVTAFDKSLGRNRIHTPLVKKWVKENKGIDL
jgi:hypothetical protein